MAGIVDPRVGVIRSITNLTAGDIPSTGPDGGPNPSNIQDDLTRLDDLGPITSAAALEARWPASGGVHQILEGGDFMLLEGETTINIGVNQIELVPPVALTGRGAKVPIVSAVDGPVIFGQGSIKNMSIQSVGMGLSAKCIDLTSIGPQLEIFDTELVGQDPGIIDSSAGFVFMQRCLLFAVADGAKALRFDGTMASLFLDQVAANVAGPTPRTGIQILATAIVGSSVGIDRCLLQSVNTGDSLIDINTSATIPAGALFTTESCQIDGPGQLFAAGSIDDTDPRMVSTSQRNGRNSLWLGDAFFSDAALPIVVTHTGAPTWDVMPFENAGAVTVLLENALNQRFTLTRRALQDWGVEGTGRTDEKFGDVGWSATVARSGGGGARPFTGRLESRPDGISGWTVIPESEATIEMAGTAPATLGTSVPFRWDRTTEFRLTVQGNAATATAVSAYRINPNAR